MEEAARRKEIQNARARSQSALWVDLFLNDPSLKFYTYREHLVESIDRQCPSENGTVFHPTMLVHGQ
jgi:hypothetical protein